ncbi:MAG: VanZ family protein, partial [Candidatus Roizmanbacteria bacterium]
MKITKYNYFIPAIIWMILIFFLSSKQRVVASDDAMINFLIFKSFHLIEYGVLYFFMLVGTVGESKKTTTYHYKKAALLTIFYALSDEFHQTFVPTRQGHLQDVGID